MCSGGGGGDEGGEGWDSVGGVVRGVVGGGAPSKLRVAKVGWQPAGFFTVKIFRRPSTVGEGWCCRGRRDGGGPVRLCASLKPSGKGRAWKIRCWAARALAFALLLVEPWGRWRSPVAWQPGNDGAVEVEVDEGEEEGGVASSSSTSSLTLVAWPPLVDIVKVADLPDFLNEWNISITEVSSSAILSSESGLDQRKSEKLWKLASSHFLRSILAQSSTVTSICDQRRYPWHSFLNALPNNYDLPEKNQIRYVYTAGTFSASNQLTNWRSKSKLSRQTEYKYENSLHQHFGWC